MKANQILQQHKLFFSQQGMPSISMPSPQAPQWHPVWFPLFIHVDKQQLLTISISPDEGKLSAVEKKKKEQKERK